MAIKCGNYAGAYFDPDPEEQDIDRLSLGGKRGRPGRDRGEHSGGEEGSIPKSISCGFWASGQRGGDLAANTGSAKSRSSFWKKK